MRLIFMLAALGSAVQLALSDVVRAETCNTGQHSAPSATTLDSMRSLAISGNAEAQAELGSVYLFGKGVPADMVQALSWLGKSVASGNALGQFLLGRHYVLAGKSETDFRTAAGLLKKSANQGCVQSFAYLAVLSLSGKGTKKDVEEGFRMAMKAASAGYPYAQTLVGTLLVTGEGTRKDAKAGFNWIQKAANTGDSAAAILLASLYLEGTGATKNPEMARSTLETVFKRGDEQAPVAAYQLGWMYMEGVGVAADNVRAFRWMVIAATSGISDSQARLNTLKKKLPESVLLSACRVFVRSSYSASGTMDNVEFDKGEIVSVLSSHKENVEVYSSSRNVLGWAPYNCIQQR